MVRCGRRTQNADRGLAGALGRVEPVEGVIILQVQEIYTEVNDKLEMSQIAQQKMQACLVSKSRPH